MIRNAIRKWLGVADARWTEAEIGAISVEIGALKSALTTAGVCTAEQLDDALARHKAATQAD